MKFRIPLLLFAGGLVAAYSAPVMPAPIVSVSSDGIELEWQGDGTLYATDDPETTGFLPVGSESPYSTGTLDDRLFTVVYDALNFTVVDTNQTESYDSDGAIIGPGPGEAYYGQDAVYSGNPPAYVDNGDGTVTDTHTALVWQQVPPAAFYSWEAAQEYADSLVLAGYDDWRLPTIKESLSLADFTGSSRPAIDKRYIDEAYFTIHDPLTVTTYVPASAENPNRAKRNIDGQYWSSNAYVGRTMNNESSTFGFNFIDGRIKSYPNGLSGSTGTCFVRCVRGNNTYGINNYIDNGDGTVTDLSTGLMWLKADSGASVGTLDWIEALAWAEGLSAAGRYDWRLPNAKELHTIVDYTRAPDASDPEMRTAAIDPVFDISETESWFWSSTSLGDDLFEWAVYFCFGQATAVDTATGEPTVNAHGAGAMRSDPKTGEPADFIGPLGGHGPQNDQIRIRNYARPVRTAFDKLDLSAPKSSPNILLIIVDDWGIDSSGLYNDDPAASLPPMPTVESLAQQGLIFTNAFSQPTCSPTRANILTGRYSFRHGIGAPVTEDIQLGEAEFTLPEAFAAAGSPYALASFGKWHLTLGGGPLVNAARPNSIGGWPHYAGSIEGTLEDYFLWDKVTNGAITADVTEYVTSVTVDDALSWIQGQADDPWFCWIGFNAAHTPFHRPPLDLHSYQDLSESPVGANRRPAYEAALEAMDSEIGRLLESIDLTNTTVIILGDNGTPASVIQSPFDSTHAKATLYEGGTHVPLIISGSSVSSPGREVGALVHCVDLFSTILDLSGIDPASIVPQGTILDAESFTALLNGQSAGRETVLLEAFGSSISAPGKALRDSRYKLIRYDSGTEEFYDLLADPNENTNLLPETLTDEQAAHYSALGNALDAY